MLALSTRHAINGCPGPRGGAHKLGMAVMVGTVIVKEEGKMSGVQIAQHWTAAVERMAAARACCGQKS